MRQYGAEAASVLELQARPLLNRTAKELGLTFRELMNLTALEVDALLKKQPIDARALIGKRKNGYALLFTDGKEVVINDQEEINGLLDRFVPKADLAAKEIKGTAASPGHAKGPAKIIFTLDEFKKMKPGDILVTTMTTPDFVPLMQQASAIITDIGGLLSHAAIISRELGKPCVIGTKVATRVLKDGDMVEVDADKGVVRKV